jgi:homoserine dehydrogenase
MPDRSLGIALLGCGIVGSGVVRILAEQREMLRRRTGVSFDLRHIVVRDPAKTRGNLPANLNLTTDPKAAIDAKDTDVVIELIGGAGGPAKTAIEQALRLGKPVVTANKSLLAAHGADLFALAKKHETCIAFEASAGGGIPIINALIRGLAANRIDALVGIVNGTCNVILTRMTRNGWSYEQALKEAQDKGFAEADPTLDVSGRDAAQKLALLASLAFNARVAEADVHVEGIDRLQKQDIEFARDLGYVIKLLAIGERWDHDRLALRVHPTLVHGDDVLAEVAGSFNAISVYGHALGHSLFYGRGAGQMPTASAVVSDLIGVALGSAQAEFRQMRIFPDATPAASVLPFHELQSRYYLRLMAKDVPGVLAQVTKALGDAGISLSAIHQRENDAGQFVPVVITTHRANEGSMQAARKVIDALPVIGAPSVCLRIIDAPQEFAGA